MGFPKIGSRGFLGRRVEPIRLGMTQRTFITCPFYYKESQADRSLHVYVGPKKQAIQIKRCLLARRLIPYFKSLKGFVSFFTWFCLIVTFTNTVFVFRIFCICCNQLSGYFDIVITILFQPFDIKEDRIGTYP